MTATRLLTDLNERAATALTVEVCDREIARYHAALRDDPKANPTVCRAQIDRWLDARLSLTQAAS